MRGTFISREGHDFSGGFSFHAKASAAGDSQFGRPRKVGAGYSINVKLLKDKNGDVIVNLKMRQYSEGVVTEFLDYKTMKDIPMVAMVGKKAQCQVRNIDW